MKRQTRGFTLTEVAIVLGIIGIVLGAIWSAAKMAYENQRTKTAREEILAIVNGWRSIYGGRQLDTINQNDVTQLSVNVGFVPNEMLTGSNPCVPGGSAATCNIIGPWQNNMSIDMFPSINGILIHVRFYTNDSCDHFTNAITNVPGLVYLSSQKGTLNFPPYGSDAVPTTADVDGFCAGSTSNLQVSVGFSL